MHKKIGETLVITQQEMTGSRFLSTLSRACAQECTQVAENLQQALRMGLSAQPFVLSDSYWVCVGLYVCECDCVHLYVGMGELGSLSLLFPPSVRHFVLLNAWKVTYK